MKSWKVEAAIIAVGLLFVGNHGKRRYQQFCE